jgi:hypothetical protein
VAPDPSAFELYGFDIMLDAQAKPWLVEVNRSPSMVVEDPVHRDTKIPLFRDTMACLAITEARLDGTDPARLAELEGPGSWPPPAPPYESSEGPPHAFQQIFPMDRESVELNRALLANPFGSAMSNQGLVRTFAQGVVTRVKVRQRALAPPWVRSAPQKHVPGASGTVSSEGSDEEEEGEEEDP